MFANRFTILHPEQVKAVAVGSPGGWPIALVDIFNGEELLYTAGIADIELLTGFPFDSAAYNAVPRLIVMGSLDDNDPLDYSDGWEETNAQLVDRLFGSDPTSRWENAESLYHKAGANAQFVLVGRIGHDRKALQSYTTEFFKKILCQELLKLLKNLAFADWSRTSLIKGRKHTVFTQARRMAVHENEYCGQIKAMLKSN